MSDTKGKNPVLIYGPPLAVVSFLVAFWASGLTSSRGPVDEIRNAGTDTVAGAPAGDAGGSRDMTAVDGGRRAGDGRAGNGRVAPGDASASASGGDGATPADRRDSAAKSAAARLQQREQRVRESAAKRDALAARTAAANQNAGANPAPVKIEPGVAYPAILVDQDTFEFGTVFEGDEVRNVFAVKNTGDADLVISRVKTSCGCTVAKYTEEAIPPGGEGVVDLVFKTKAKKGNQKKTAYIYSNDPRTPQQKLYMQGHVQPQFWIEPRERIDLGSIDRFQKIEDRKVTVKWLKELDIEITGLVVRNDAVKVEQKPWEDDKHRGAELTISIDDVSSLLKNGQISRVNESIQIQTNNEAFKKQFLFLSAMIKREVMARPQAITFGVAKPGKDVVRKLQLTAAEGFEMTEPEISCPIDYVRFDMAPMTKGNGYEITATLDVDKAPLGQFFREHLEIKTNSKDVPQMSILVTGRVGSAKKPANVTRPRTNSGAQGNGTQGSKPQ